MWGPHTEAQRQQRMTDQPIDRKYSSPKLHKNNGQLEYIPNRFFRNFSKHFEIFLAGVCCPPDPPLKRSFVTFDRGGQTGPPRSNYFFSAPLTTRAPPGRPAGRLTQTERPAERPLTTRANPPMNVAHLLRQPETCR